jgi:hypothetical protein
MTIDGSNSLKINHTLRQAQCKNSKLQFVHLELNQVNKRNLITIHHVDISIHEQ